MMKRSVKEGRSILVACAIFLAVAVTAPVAHALPGLQLDISGGFYDTTTQTTLTTSDTFTLYALLDTRKFTAAELSDTYYVSVALSPQVSSGATLGSFTFTNGATVITTYAPGGMTYGVPPLDAIVAKDPGDLAQHSVFPTYFSEFGFTFDQAKTAAAYNVQDNPGGLQAGSGPLLYAAFEVDKAALNSPYQLHFDLYSTKLRSGDTDIKYFAPYSHDAGTTTQVPEPSAALAMVVGLVMFGVWQWRKSSAFGG